MAVVYEAIADGVGDGLCDLTLGAGLTEGLSPLDRARAEEHDLSCLLLRRAHEALDGEGLGLSTREERDARRQRLERSQSGVRGRRDAVVVDLSASEQA